MSFCVVSLGCGVRFDELDTFRGVRRGSGCRRSSDGGEGGRCGLIACWGHSGGEGLAGGTVMRDGGATVLLGLQLEGRAAVGGKSCVGVVVFGGGPVAVLMGVGGLSVMRVRGGGKAIAICSSGHGGGGMRKGSFAIRGALALRAVDLLAEGVVVVVVIGGGGE